ncbi:MAG: phosphotransferase [Alphaproteobacteria bacterium]|nr:phosphotransferase [Alphaproteobacteria bacterium]
MPVSRPLEIAGFLERHGWGNADAQALPGDFSPRRYAWLAKPGGGTAILMDADIGQKTPAFVALAGILRAHGLDAPEIYAAEAARGLVLMQDFGNRTVGAAIDAGEDAEPYLLRAADGLAKLHGSFAPADVTGLDLPLFDAALFAQQAELFLDAWLPFAKKRDATENERADFRDTWLAVLRPFDKMPRSLLLRDFMPDNLMDVPDGRLGVLDFQDAGIGPVAYDIASLCEEVRRDGMFARLPVVIGHYIEQAQSPVAQNDLLRACTVFSAQRHTRILGIVAQLALRQGRRDKLAYVPRIQNHLRRVMAEPCLAPVRAWMEGIDGL